MGKALVCLLLAVTLLVIFLPRHSVPVLAYRTALRANNEIARFSFNGSSGSILRVSNRTGKEGDVDIVRVTSENALKLLQGELGFVPRWPISVVIDVMPQDTLGYYRFGEVGLIAPSDWLWYLGVEGRAKYFESHGPGLHELTHYAVDHMAYGNYPAWLSEGLALFMELKYQDFRWVGNEQHEGVISYDKIDEYLTDPTFYMDAYEQSLSMVEYMYYQEGSLGIQKLLANLGQGHAFEKALSDVYGLKVDTLMGQWYHWRQGSVGTTRIVAQR